MLAPVRSPERLSSDHDLSSYAPPWQLQNNCEQPYDEAAGGGTAVAAAAAARREYNQSGRSGGGSVTGNSSENSQNRRATAATSTTDDTPRTGCSCHTLIKLVRDIHAYFTMMLKYIHGI